MRLLIINYEMDHGSAVLAWQARVAEALSRECERVVVLTERRAPGFESGEAMVVEEMTPHKRWLPTRVGRWAAVAEQAAGLVREHDLQACFVHMAHHWTYRTAPLLRRTPMVLWYAHGTVTPSLRLACRAAARVVTSTPQGMRVDTPKKRVIGQGVDMELFGVPVVAPRRDDVLYVGRISPRKRIDRLLDAMDALRRKDPTSPIRLRLIGPALSTEDMEYERRLRTRTWETGLQGCVDWVGFVPMHHVPLFYASAFCHANVSQTGSLDKTVLEALSCGCPVLTSNEAFRDLLAERPALWLDDDSPEALADRLLAAHRTPPPPAEALRALLIGRHDLASFPGRLLPVIREVLR